MLVLNNTAPSPLIGFLFPTHPTPTQHRQSQHTNFCISNAIESDARPTMIIIWHAKDLCKIIFLYIGVHGQANPAADRTPIPSVMTEPRICTIKNFWQSWNPNDGAAQVMHL